MSSLPPELIVHIGSLLSYKDRTSFRTTCHYYCDLLEFQRTKWVESIPVRFCHYSYRSSSDCLYIGWFPTGCAFDQKQEYNYRRYTVRESRQVMLTKRLTLRGIPLSSLRSRIVLSTQGTEKYSSIVFTRCISLHFVDPIDKCEVRVPIGHQSNVNATTRGLPITVEFGNLELCEDHLHASLHVPLYTFEVPKRLTHGFDKWQLYAHYS